MAESEFLRCITHLKFCLIVAVSLPFPATVLGSTELTIVQTWEATSHTLNQMKLSRNTGYLYIGAASHIYQLDSSLRLVSEASTPQTDGTNRLALYNTSASEDLVITCGSEDTRCPVRSGENVSEILSYFIQPFSGKNTVAFTTYFLEKWFLFLACPAEERNGGSCDGFSGIKWQTVGESPVSKSKVQFTKLDLGAGDAIITKEFVDAIAIGHYRLFFSVQEDVSTGVIVSRVAQICQKTDKSMYVDMRLKCGNFSRIQRARHAQTSDGREIIVALFAREDGSDLSSAICVFALETVWSKLEDNVRGCYRGRDIPKDYISGKGDRCTKGDFSSIQLTQRNVLCNDNGFDQWQNVIGDRDLYADPVLFFHNELMTSLAVKAVNRSIVAFVGNTFGELQKLSVYPAALARTLSRTTTPQDSASTDVALEVADDAVFVMTNHQVLKVSIENCASYTSCSDCLSGKDPHCGWCMLEGRCTVAKACSPDWLSSVGAEQCPVITAVKPEPNLPVEEVTQLSITVSIMPRQSVQYQCVFRDTSSLTTLNERSLADVNYATRSVGCRGPDLRSFKSSVKGSLAITVSLHTNVSSTPLVEGTLNIYNCETFQSCFACTNDSWKCDWIVHGTECIGINKFTGNDRIVQSGSASRCPMIDDIAPTLSQDENDTMYIHSDVAHEFHVTGRNLPNSPPLPDTYYHCVLSPFKTQYKAVWLNDTTVRCINVTVSDDISQTGTASTSLMVYWKSLPIDSTVHLTVEVYECGSLVKPTRNCGECQSFQYSKPYYQCGWCDNICQYQTHCGEGLALVCPPPEIHSIQPFSAHVNGSAILEITGINLGSRVQEIQGTVWVAGVRCRVIEENFIPSNRFNCELEQRSQPGRGKVSISLAGREEVLSKEVFVFKVPVINAISPTIGPLSGGSSITIYGQDLDVGRERVAYIGNIRCKETRNINASMEICVTGRARAVSVQPLKIRMRFDQATESSEEKLFRYLADPTITDIHPTSSFKSGGRVITVSGTNLHAIQKPAMFVRYQGRNTTRSDPIECHGSANGTKVYCRSPQMVSHSRKRRNVQADDARLTDSHETSLSEPVIGFLMDDVKSVQDLPKYFPELKYHMVYYNDPDVYNFTENKKFDEFLVIKGRRLRVAAEEEDFDVRIGGEQCNLTSVENETITCKPPISKPTSDDDTSATSAKIIVMIGYLNYSVGNLEYGDAHSGQHTDEQQKLEYTIAGVVVTILILMLLGTAIGLYVMVRKRRASKREKESLVYKMDKLEAAFRTQCRDEFAALQTAVSDLTSDLEGGQVLFRDYDVYASKILFTAGKEHPAMSQPIIINNDAIQAMEIFKGLLRNPQFLRLMVKTLECQKSFSIQDKSNVASMLVIINEDNMEYITEVLKTLLNDLVDKTVAAQSAKILLRRSESIVEKLLTYWLSLCLYQYLKGACGSSLYILYKAMKIQIERGPLDYITCCGKYTLSEDKLLPARDKDINTHSLNLQVVHEDKHVEVQVLDCDTVTQAKAKMLEVLYKNVPYSQRPSVHDTVLVTQEEDNTQRSLHDEDASCVREGIWKKINTLQHYSVGDGSSVVLTVSKASRASDNLVLLPGASPDQFIIGSLKRSRQVVRTISGSNFWHLTKQHREEDDEVQLSSDLFLPRLLNTKATLQKYIDDFFTDMLAVGEEPPLVIKYLFDFLDSAALRLQITDPDVLHTWKCNSLLLRFWVNTIKNPEFVFDIHKPLIVDSCLSVVAQTLMDSCSTAPLQLGKHSPSNKLLFAKDIPRYKEMVKTFFQKISEAPAISDQDFNSYLTENVSQKFSGPFNQTSALLEVYKYAAEYKDQLLADLKVAEEATPGVYAPLAGKMRQAYKLMGSGAMATKDNE